MSDSVSAYYDDLEEWHRLCQLLNIDVGLWGVYSKEASYAVQGHRDHGYTDTRLKLYVKHCMQRAELEKQIQQEEAEFLQWLKLQDKFGQ